MVVKPKYECFYQNCILLVALVKRISAIYPNIQFHHSKFMWLKTGVGLTRFGCIRYPFISSQRENASFKLLLSTQTYESKGIIYQYLVRISSVMQQKNQHSICKKHKFQIKHMLKTQDCFNLNDCCIRDNIRFNTSRTHCFQNLHS